MDPAATPTCLGSHQSCRHRNDSLYKPGTLASNAMMNDESSGSVAETPECGLQPTEADFKTENGKKVEKLGRGWRRIIRNFTPSYVRLTQSCSLGARLCNSMGSVYVCVGLQKRNLNQSVFMHKRG